MSGSQNPESTGDLQMKVARDHGSAAFIEQYEVGLELQCELQGFGFARVKLK